MTDNDNNPFDDAAASVMHQQATQIRNNVLATQNENPDQAANYQHLAQFTNTPIQTVYAQPDAIKQQAAMQQLDTGKLTGQYPHLAQFLTDQNNVAKSHDDIQPLAGVEGAAKALPLPAPANVAPDFEAPEDALNPSGGPAAYSLLQGLGSSFNRAEKAINLLVGAFPTAYDKAASLITGTDTTAAQDAYFKNFVDPLDQKASAFQLSPNADSLQKVTHGAGDLLGTLSQIALTGGMGETAAPALTLAQPTALGGVGEALGHAAKSMAFPSITSAVNTGNDVYQATGSAAQATKAAIAAYGTNTAMGVLPLSLEGGLGTRLATGFPLGMLTGEANRQVMNAALPQNMQAPADLESTIINGITGAALAGVMGGSHSVVQDALQEAHDNGLKVDQSVDTLQKLQALDQMATQSKLRGRDSGAFQEFVQNISEDGHAPDLFIDATKLNDVLRQSGVTPTELEQKMPDVAAQLNEGLQTQGYVKIPVADFATHLAGGPMVDALMPHMKTDPDGMTYEEGQAYLQQQQEGLSQQAQDLADQQQAQDTRDQQLGGIQKDIQDQLEATGRFPTSVAAQYAGLHKVWYDEMSNRMGLSPDELRQQFPLKVLSAGDGELSQGERGGFSPGRMEIYLSKDADLSTFLHESGHFYLEAMHQMSAQPGAPADVKGDFDSLLQAFKIKGDTPEERSTVWNAMGISERRDGHEQFAEGFERYLLDGKAPTPALQSMFGRFRSWLLNVYRNFRLPGTELSPEVRGVMDRMLASQDAITEAQKARNYVAADLVAENSPEMAQYKALGREATQDALDAMQARSVRTMKWGSNAKSKAMKELQGQAKAERATITDEVTKEVEKEPVYAAERFLRRGEMDKPENETNAQRKQRESTLGRGSKLDIDSLKELYGDNSAAPWRYLDTGTHGLVGKDGLDPDLVADMFGFRSGKELVESLLSAPKMKDKIEGMTDQRMLERHGDLTDPVSIERAAEAAIHNEFRAKMMATGLKILTKTPMSSDVLNAHAKALAETTIAAKKIGDLRPAQYSAAEGRANKELLKLAPRDTIGAAQAQRAALLNNRLFTAANEAVTDVRKALTYVKRLQSTNALKKIDPEERDQIVALLKNYDFRANPTDEPTRAQKNLQQWLESQQQAGYTPIVDPAALNAQPRTRYRDMTVEELRGLRDTLRSIEKIGRDKMTAMFKGQRVELNDLVHDTFIPKMQERPDQFSTSELHDRPENRGLSTVGTTLDKMASGLRGMQADLKAQYFKANYYDSHEILGPFHELFDQVFEANGLKVRMVKAQSDTARETAQRLGKDWQKGVFDMEDNRVLLDPIATKEQGAPVMLRLTHANVIQMAAHAGSESNFDKLAKGYGWEPQDVWKFLDGRLSAQDAEAVKAQWEMANKHWPETKAMYERMGQVVPPKIEPRPYRLRLKDDSVVDMPGGYMPIRYDPLRSRLGAKQQAEKSIDPENGKFGYDFFGRDTTTNGSMNARSEGYTDAIDLGHEAFEHAIAETIHDLAYRETLVNTNKIITHRDFRAQFMKTYGREDYDALHTWLGRIANSEVMDRQVGNMGRIMRYTRTGMVMNAIALRASTVLKHGGSAGIKTLGYFTGGGEKYLASRMTSMATDYAGQIADARAKFSEINSRLMQQDRDYRETISSLYKSEGLQSRAERFGHSAVAWADMMTAVPTAHAAYDRAITEGIPKGMGGTGEPMTEAQAIAYANSVVREAHGSNMESTRSNVMTNPHEGVKMFTTLYGFMNNTYGQASDTMSKLRTAGISKPEVMARSMMALVVPALWAGILTEGLPHKDDWEKWLAKSLGGEALGMVPFARDLFSFFQGYKHAGVIGVESWMQSVAQPLLDAAKVATGHDAPGAISHAADALGMGLHIPGLGQLGKIGQYVHDVQTGTAPKPKSALEYVKNAVLGPPKL